ncbi:MAG: hypothetical protein KAU16_01660, partial [Methanophagales archaeon]|nr:hypothetical protein [Methanophagales archaeon]
LSSLLNPDWHSHPLQWGNAIGEPHTGNPYVRFDEGSEVERPPPTLPWGRAPQFEIWCLEFVIIKELSISHHYYPRNIFR